MVAGKGFSLNRIKPKFAACPVRGMSRELLFLQSSPPTWTAQFAKAKQHTSQEAQADAGRQRRRRRRLPEPEETIDGGGDRRKKGGSTHQRLEGKESGDWDPIAAASIGAGSLIGCSGGVGAS